MSHCVATHLWHCAQQIKTLRCMHGQPVHAPWFHSVASKPFRMSINTHISHICMAFSRSSKRSSSNGERCMTACPCRSSAQPGSASSGRCATCGAGALQVGSGLTSFEGLEELSVPGMASASAKLRPSCFEICELRGFSDARSQWQSFRLVTQLKYSRSVGDNNDANTMQCICKSASTPFLKPHIHKQSI